MKHPLSEAYYGIKIVFKRPPIQGYKLTEFVFSGKTLLEKLLQSLQRSHELFQEPLYFDKPRDFPITCNNPADWLDCSMLLRQGKFNPNTPKLALNIGGRKIITHVPSDKYCYDHGKLPLHVVRTNIPLPDDDIVPTGSLITFANPTDDIKIVMNPDKKGDDSVKNTQGRERLSYIDFYLSLKNHYGSNFDDSLIAKECRNVLSGNILGSEHAEIIPVMLTTMFGAEVSRNRACLVSGIMLLDLIESRTPAPSLTPDKETSDVYCFKNSLWHPDLYDVTPQERRKNPEKSELATLGGFHPMAHKGSWEEEFAEEGPYQHKTPLSTSHVKSLIIFIDWIMGVKNLLPESIQTIIKLNKKDYEESHQKCKDNFNKEYTYRSRSRPFELSGLNLMVLNFALRSLMQKRLSNFDYMLTSAEQPALSATTSQHYNTDTTSIAILTQLNMFADKQVAQRKKEDQEKRLRLLEEARNSYIIDSQTAEKIKSEVTDEATCVVFINRLLENSFSLDVLRYCKTNTELKEYDIATLFFRLNNIRQFGRRAYHGLITMLCNINEHEKIVVYKLILTCNTFLKEFSSGYTSLSTFLSQMSHSTPTSLRLIDILLDENNRNLLSSFSGEELFNLCKNSNYLFKNLILNHPELFRKILDKCIPYEISENLYSIIRGNNLKEEDFIKIGSYNYSEMINTIVNSDSRNFVKKSF